MSTEKISQKIRKRFDHNQAKRVLRDKYQAKMVFAHAGGMWCAGTELITQCNLCIAHNHDQAVLQDMHNNPVQVDAEELKNLAFERWQEQMNAWLEEFNQLSSQR